MMSEDYFKYLSLCHISNRYENTTTFPSKTTSLVSLQADYHVNGFTCGKKSYLNPSNKVTFVVFPLCIVPIERSIFAEERIPMGV